MYLSLPYMESSGMAASVNLVMNSLHFSIHTHALLNIKEGARDGLTLFSIVVRHVEILLERELH